MVFLPRSLTRLQSLELADLPASRVANKVIAVKGDASGYELVDKNTVGLGYFRNIAMVTDQAGYVGDGVANDTAAINAAIDEAGANGVVVFPAKLTSGIGSKLNAKYNFQTWLGNHHILKALSGFSTTVGQDRIVDMGLNSSTQLIEPMFDDLRFDINNQNIWAMSNSTMNQEFKTAVFSRIQVMQGSNFANTTKGVLNFKNTEALCLFDQIFLDRMRGHTSTTKRFMVIDQTDFGGNIWITRSSFSNITDNSGLTATGQNVIMLAIGGGSTTAGFDRTCIQNCQFFNNPQNFGAADTDRNIVGLEYFFNDSDGSDFDNKDHRAIDLTFEDLSIGTDINTTLSNGCDIYFQNCHWENKEGLNAPSMREPNHRAVRINGSVRATFDPLCTFYVIGSNTTANDWYAIENNSSKVVIIKAKGFTMRQSTGNPTFSKVFGTGVSANPRKTFLGGDCHIPFSLPRSGTPYAVAGTRYFSLFGDEDTTATLGERAVSLRKYGVARGVSVKPYVNGNSASATLAVMLNGASIGTATINAGSVSQVNSIFTKTIGSTSNNIVEVDVTDTLEYRLVTSGTVSLRMAGFLIFEEFAEDAG